MQYFKAVKFESFIIYMPNVHEDELEEFISSSYTTLTSHNPTESIIYDQGKYTIFEWKEYYINCLDTRTLNKVDFENIGKLYTTDFGIILIRNFIGEVLFKGQLFYVDSQKISREEFNGLLNLVENNIKNLITLQFDSIGVMGGEFSIISSSHNNYFKYAKIINLMENDLLLPYFVYIRRNAVTSFNSVKTTKHITQADHITSDTLIDIFSGQSTMLKTNKKSKINDKFKGYLPEYVNEYKHYLDIDTTENQFVKFFLEHLIGILSDFINEMDDLQEGNNGEGQLENSSGTNLLLNDIINYRTELLNEYNHRFYKDISNLSFFNFSNTVLTQKYGYRNLFKEFININNQPISILDTDSMIALYQNKSVDKLYEYICLFGLLNILDGIYSQSDYSSDKFLSKNFKSDMIVSVPEDGSVIISFNSINDLPSAQIVFQKAYTLQNNGSWSVMFEPDFSLKVDYGNNDIKLYHFDSKFKVRSDSSEKNEDIQKMHSYKDGILNTYGSYVLYPGNRLSEYTNDINGSSLMNIGAIPLKFDENNDLKTHINNILKNRDSN